MSGARMPDVAPALLKVRGMATAPLNVPRLGEVALYLRSHGLRRAVAKLFSGYLAGREQWYLTIEDLGYWVGAHLDPDGLEIRAATVADLPLMESFMARQHPNTLGAWCRDDHVFFVALADGRAVSYRCVSRVVHPAVQPAITLAPHQVYMVDEFTDPAFRRRGITRRLAIATNPTLMAAGGREVVGIHRTDNRDTIAATRAKNIVTIGRITISRLGPRLWYRYEAFMPEVEPPLAAPVRRAMAADAGLVGTEPTVHAA